MEVGGSWWDYMEATERLVNSWKSADFGGNLSGCLEACAN